MGEPVRASEIEHMPSIQNYQIGGMKDRLGRSGAGGAAPKPGGERFHFADACRRRASLSPPEPRRCGAGADSPGASGRPATILTFYYGPP